MKEIQMLFALFGDLVFFLQSFLKDIRFFKDFTFDQLINQSLPHVRFFFLDLVLFDFLLELLHLLLFFAHAHTLGRFGNKIIKHRFFFLVIKVYFHIFISSDKHAPRHLILLFHLIFVPVLIETCRLLHIIHKESLIHIF